jgi:hypothetical protein
MGNIEGGAMWKSEPYHRLAEDDIAYRSSGSERRLATLREVHEPSCRQKQHVCFHAAHLACSGEPKVPDAVS